jgi:hypothetical protein
MHLHLDPVDLGQLPLNLLGAVSATPPLASRLDRHFKAPFLLLTRHQLAALPDMVAAARHAKRPTQHFYRIAVCLPQCIDH